MPRRRQWGVLALTSKVRRPAILTARGIKLLFFKNRLWRRRSSSLGTTGRRYSYGYYFRQFEYEFSPSSTPLFTRSNRVAAKKRLAGLLHCLLCGAAGAAGVLEEDKEESQVLGLEDATLEDDDKVDDDGDQVYDANFSDAEDIVMSPPTQALEWISDEDEEGEEEGGDDEDSVDNRAEKFIERFYENIRIQRQESFAEWEEMLLRSC